MSSACSKVVVGLALGALTVVGCAAKEDDEDEDPPASSTGDALTFRPSTPLVDSDMRPIATPAGMPKPYEQPDSTGWFGERGKCGPTAVANALRLYWIDVTPQQADAAGVHWLIGTMGRQIEKYLDKSFPELGCSLEHPEDGLPFLRAEIDGGHPVMVWFNIDGLDSHWVTAIGHKGKGDTEDLIVMSWGRYYAIAMKKLALAWTNVYGIHNPAVVCAEKTTLLR